MRYSCSSRSKIRPSAPKLRRAYSVRTVSAFAVLLALLAGLAGSIQVAIMGRLGQRIGSFEALAWASLLSGALALAVLLAVRQSLVGISAAARQPTWLW